MPKCVCKTINVYVIARMYFCTSTLQVKPVQNKAENKTDDAS